MIRYLLVMAMIILTPPKGNGGMPLAPKPACMGKVGEGTRRPPMFVGLAEQIKLQCSDIIKVKITI